jgi:hypothetical protein
MRRWILFLLLIFSEVQLSFAAKKPPNLSGHWEMNEERSTLSPFLKANNYKEVLIIMGHVLQATAVVLVHGVAVYRFLNKIVMSTRGSLSIRVSGAASQVPTVHEVQLEQWKFVTDYT